MMKLFFGTIAALFLSVIVHAMAVLSLPLFSTSNIYNQTIDARLLPNRFYTQTQMQAAGVQIGGLDPALETALCPLNLTQSPMVVRAPLIQGYWSISVFDADMNNVAVFNKSNFRGGLTDIVVGAVQRDFLLASQDEIVSVLLPSFAGFVQLRTMAGLKDQENEALKAISRSVCAPYSR
jgi:uncharacterized membrane protein